MQFQKYDLGQLQKGQFVEVTLKGSAANVRLMDSSNFQNYKSGRRHKYYGGYVTRSPYRVSVPNNGHWYVAIDLGGYSGHISSSVNVLEGALPQAKQPSLSSVPSLVRDKDIPTSFGEEPIVRKYDVFISSFTKPSRGYVLRPRGRPQYSA